MQAIRETASNIAASAISGMEKTKATVQEKMEIMAAQHPMEKQIATQKEEERIVEAERTKIATQRHNALVRQLSLSGSRNSQANFPTSAAKATVRTRSLPARTVAAEAMTVKMPNSARSAGDGGTQLFAVVKNSQPEGTRVEEAR